MFTLNCKGKLLSINRPVVMGILNINSDSFFANSRHTADGNLLNAAETMLSDGAAILDMGGQSTRPGSLLMDAEVELSHVVPAIEAVHHRFPEAIISVDTFHGAVASAAVSAGASIVNDISAGAMDDTLLDTVASLGVPYVLMHMQGTPQNMQHQPRYENVTKEVLYFLTQKLKLLREKGVKDVIVDPGFGFGKTITHNFELLQHLDLFQLLRCPVMLGISRKGIVYKTLDVDASQALNGTTVLHTIGLSKGAQILRVHDVKEAMEAIRLLDAMCSFH